MTGPLASCSVAKPCGGGGHEREETAGFFTSMLALTSCRNTNIVAWHKGYKHNPFHVCPVSIT